MKPPQLNSKRYRTRRVLPIPRELCACLQIKLLLKNPREFTVVTAVFLSLLNTYSAKKDALPLRAPLSKKYRRFIRPMLAQFVIRRATPRHPIRTAAGATNTFVAIHISPTKNLHLAHGCCLLRTIQRALIAGLARRLTNFGLLQHTVGFLRVIGISGRRRLTVIIICHLVQNRQPSRNFGKLFTLFNRLSLKLARNIYGAAFQR